MDVSVSFGLWLEKRRKALDLTREKLAQKAGCSVSALRKIETEERRPSKQLAELLANTDIGAVLSHAASGAREMGILAVAGCGNATMRLKAGDRVRVDGNQGIVEILADS